MTGYLNALERSDSATHGQSNSSSVQPTSCSNLTRANSPVKEKERFYHNNSSIQQQFFRYTPSPFIFRCNLSTYNVFVIIFHRKCNIFSFSPIFIWIAEPCFLNSIFLNLLYYFLILLFSIYTSCISLFKFIFKSMLP